MGLKCGLGNSDSQQVLCLELLLMNTGNGKSFSRSRLLGSETPGPWRWEAESMDDTQSFHFISRKANKYFSQSVVSSAVCRSRTMWPSDFYHLSWTQSPFELHRHASILSDSECPTFILVVLVSSPFRSFNDKQNFVISGVVPPDDNGWPHNHCHKSLFWTESIPMSYHREFHFCIPFMLTLNQWTRFSWTSIGNFTPPFPSVPDLQKIFPSSSSE